MSVNNENRNSLKASKASTYLSGEENELVFMLLGRRCQSQCTTVAQLYHTEGPDHSRWVKKHTGALCFVKDNTKRSYFARMFCLMKHELIWEQEMYDTVEIFTSKPYFLCFEGQDGVIGLNFAFEEEAEMFMNIAMTTVQNRNRRREERKSRMKKEPPARPPPISKTATSDDNNITLRNVTNFPINHNHELKSKKRAKKITKADIGTPSNFKHVTHVGWNAKSGFDLSGEDEELRPFLVKAGVSENQLKDRRTRDFIYDFIQTNNVEEIVRKETKKPAAPKVPTRNQNADKISHRQAPPPPPPVQRDYHHQNNNIPENFKKDNFVPSTNIGSLPMEIQSNKKTLTLNAPPAPPPPPPMPLQITANSPSLTEHAKSVEQVTSNTPDIRSALMESIRKGTQLKPIEIINGNETRNDLLSEIREGIELRPISDRPNQVNRSSDGTGAGTDALADALRRALDQRKMAINGTSSSESENENSDDGEWSD